MAWKGFLRESYDYISPRGFKGWVKFIVGFPRAWFIYYWLTLRDNFKSAIAKSKNSIKEKEN